MQIFIPLDERLERTSTKNSTVALCFFFSIILKVFLSIHKLEFICQASLIMFTINSDRKS